MTFGGNDQTPVLDIGAKSAQSWQVTLSAVIEGVSVPIKSYPVGITFNSPSHDLFHWDQVSGESEYSTTQGSGWYLSGSLATLTIGSTTVDISPGIREQFAGWQGVDGVSNSGADPSITFSASIPVTETAQWVGQYSLTINSRDGIINGGTSGSWYDNGTQLILTATPNTGYSFKDWSQNGQVVSTSRNLTYSMDSATSLQADYISDTGNSGNSSTLIAIVLGGVIAAGIGLFFMRRNSLSGGN